MKRQKLVKVNRNKLEEENEAQAERYLKASDLQTKYGRQKEDLEKDINKLEAKLARKYRLQPMKYLGIERATDKAIAEKLSLNKDVDKLRTELIEIKYKYKKAENLVKSLDQRRSSIKYLAELWLGGYWQEIRVNPVDEADIRMRRKNRKKILKTMKGDEEDE